MHLIVHAGPPKTGTTALQSVLRQNSAALAEQGVVYHRPVLDSLPEAPPEWALMLPHAWSDGSLPGPLLGHFPDLAAAQAWSAACWARFEQQMRRDRPPLVVISSEHFANMADRTGFLARLRGIFARVTMVGYARDPVSLYASTVAELIRGGHRLSDLILPGQFNYRGVTGLRRFEPLLAPGALLMREWHPPGGAGPDVPADFIRLLSGLAGRALHLPAPPDETNPALPGAVTAWLLSVNEIAWGTAPPAARAQVLARLLQSRPLAEAALPPLRLSDPLLEALLRAGAADALAWLWRCHGIGLPGGDAAPASAPAPQPLPPAEQQKRRLRARILSHLTPAALRLITREAVALHR